jgi:hypothetical protein
MLLVSVESEFEIAGQVLADFLVELSLNEIQELATTLGGSLTSFEDTHRGPYLNIGPSPGLHRGHPVDVLVQVLHGFHAVSTAEEANAISGRIGEFRNVFESLHPTPILSPIAQGQQLAMESQGSA